MHTQVTVPTTQQGMLFTSLPQQLRRYKSELEEDFLPPRELAMRARYVPQALGQ